QYGQQPPVQQYGQQPPVQPYGQQPPVQPYGQQPPVQPYGQQPPVQQYPGYGQQSYATGAPREANGSAIALTILSVASLLFCNFFALVSIVVGIMALTKNSTDPEGSRRLTKTGWITFAVAWVVAIVSFVIFVSMFNTP